MTRMEKTLLFVKPDGVRRGLVGEVISRIEKKGLRIRALRMMNVDLELANRLYEEHREKPFFDELVAFVTSGPIVAMMLEGEQAVKTVRELMGATDPKKAAPGTIRGDFGEVITENIVHGSDSPESAKRELELFSSNI